MGGIQKSGGGGVYLNQNAVMGVITADLAFFVIIFLIPLDSPVKSAILLVGV